MKVFKVVSPVFCLAFCVVASVSASYGGTGTLTVKFGSAMEVIEGGVTNTYDKNDTFVPSAIPCVYKMRPGGMSEGQRTFAITGTDQVKSANVYRFPLPGDGNWVRVALNPYPASDTTVTLTGYKVSKVYYADEKYGSDSYDGTAATHEAGTDHGPKPTLQAAHDVAAAGSTSAGFPVVLVAPGFYSNNVSVATYTPSSGSASSSNRRLYATKNIGFIATGGAENTFIVGAPDPATGGNGADAVGGVYMTNASNPSFLQGFTITGCYSPASQSGIAHYGSAFNAGGSHRIYCLDCIISNNYAKTKFPVSSYGVFQRTKIMENESSQAMTSYGWFAACVFAGNRVTNGDDTTTTYGLHNQSYTYFCTYDLRNANQPSGRKRLDGDSTLLREGLVYGLTDKSTITSSVWNDSQAIDKPVFADADARDYRLGALSPAIDACSYESDLTVASRIVMTADIDGRMPVFHDGKVRLGAVWNEPPLPVTVLYGQGGGMSVSGASLGTNIVSSAGEITVTATSAATRPFVGFEVNGVMESGIGNTYSFTPSLLEGAVNSVKAIYSSDWYVDCVHGSDANDGGTLAQAKATIRAATTNAVSGDVIHVAPGTYGDAEGAQMLSATGTSGFRVIVPAGVTLVGTEGAENTLIVGANASAGNVDNATYGTGTDGVRCVCASNGATVCGFTLTGGRGAGGSSGSNASAAFFSPTSLGAMIEGCIVSNNAAYNSTINQAVVKRCRVIGNIALNTTSGANACPAGKACSWYGCIIAGNLGNGTVGNASCIESCTFGKNTLQNGTSSAQTLYNSGPVVNSLFTYSSDRFQGTTYATNCIFARAKWDAVVESNCLFSTSVSLTNYKPNPGSKVIDAGDNALVSGELEGAKDIFGTPRVLNVNVDIGAVEYDWRPLFAERVGKHLTITDVSPSVTTNATGGVTIPSGVLAGTVEAGGRYFFTFEISGGTLEAFVGGASAGTYSAAGEQTITLEISDAATEFRFVFMPDSESPGSAVLKQIASNKGFLLIFK